MVLAVAVITVSTRRMLLIGSAMMMLLTVTCGRVVAVIVLPMLVCGRFCQMTVRFRLCCVTSDLTRVGG